MDRDFVSWSHYWEQWHSHFGPTISRPGQRCTSSFCRWDEGLAWLAWLTVETSWETSQSPGLGFVAVITMLCILEISLWFQSGMPLLIFWCGLSISLCFFSLVSPPMQKAYFFLWEMVYCWSGPCKTWTSKFHRAILSRKMAHRHEKVYDPLSPLPTYHRHVRTCSLVDWQEERERKKISKYLLKVGQSCALELQSGCCFQRKNPKAVLVCPLQLMDREPSHCF